MGPMDLLTIPGTGRASLNFAPPPAQPWAEPPADTGILSRFGTGVSARLPSFLDWLSLWLTGAGSTQSRAADVLAKLEQATVELVPASGREEAQSGDRTSGEPDPSLQPWPALDVLALVQVLLANTLSVRAVMNSLGTPDQAALPVAEGSIPDVGPGDITCPVSGAVWDAQTAAPTGPAHPDEAQATAVSSSISPQDGGAGGADFPFKGRFFGIGSPASQISPPDPPNLGGVIGQDGSSPQNWGVRGAIWMDRQFPIEKPTPERAGYPQDWAAGGTNWAGEPGHGLKLAPMGSRGAEVLSGAKEQEPGSRSPEQSEGTGAGEQGREHPSTSAPLHLYTLAPQHPSTPAPQLPADPLRREVASEALVQIEDALRQASAGGRSAVRLKLKPDGLGAVDIQLSWGQDGLVIRFNADHDQVRKLIETNLGRLQSALQDRGVQVDQVWVNLARGGADFNLALHVGAQGGGQRGGGSASTPQQRTHAGSQPPRDEASASVSTGEHAVDYRV